MLATAIEAGHSPQLWFAKKVSELHPQVEDLARHQHNKAEQTKSHEQAIHLCQHANTFAFSPIALFSCEERYAPSILMRTSMLAAIIARKTFTEQ